MTSDLQFAKLEEAFFWSDESNTELFFCIRVHHHNVASPAWSTVVPASHCLCWRPVRGSTGKSWRETWCRNQPHGGTQDTGTTEKHQRYCPRVTQAEIQIPTQSRLCGNLTDLEQRRRCAKLTETWTDSHCSKRCIHLCKRLFYLFSLLTVKPFSVDWCRCKTRKSPWGMNVFSALSEAKLSKLSASTCQVRALMNLHQNL